MAALVPTSSLSAL
jgi:hypothetical protein